MEIISKIQKGMVRTMAMQVFPTKGNLISTKKSFALAKLGYELLDRKRNILIRELMTLVEIAKTVRENIEGTYQKAYESLVYANISLGLISEIASTMPVEDSIKISYRSVMGVEIPSISLDDTSLEMSYGFYNTNSSLDLAYKSFVDVKKMTVMLAEVENGIFRLALNIKKTQSRANALKNIIIPKFEDTIKYITNSLEEKEREDFSRLKVIKSYKIRKK